MARISVLQGQEPRPSAQDRYLQENVDNWAAVPTALNLDLRTINNFDIYIQGGSTAEPR